MQRFVFTCGDINGIGPEIILKSLSNISHHKHCQFIFVVPKNVLTEISTATDINLPFNEVRKTSELENCKSNLIAFLIGGSAKITKGKPTKYSGKVSFKALETAHEIINKGLADAMITAPISKEAFKLAGINFPGHTELLAEWNDTKLFNMMFLSKGFICSLVTIHEAIKDVSKLINKSRLRDTIYLTSSVVQYKLRVKNPRIAVLGLNPHAGENGKIGSEETRTIKPVIDNYNDLHIDGPFVPDAFFGTGKYKYYDAVIGMYHDQVLIPFKMLNFDKGVNFTAGLKYVRTSPDHGTAYDIAWQNKANPTSIIEAYKWAKKLSR